jgi:hypothetical protein
MADSPLLPGSHSGPVDPKTGLWRREWYGFLRDLVRFVQQTNGNTDSLEAVLARLEALENEPVVEVGSVIGDMTVDVQGILANGGVVLLRLLNDTTDPGATYYYGTNADGDKGWHLLGDALLEGAGITLTVDGTTGEITIALSDVTPTAGGSFLLTAFDAQGRRSHEAPGDAGDVPVDDAGWSELSGANVQAALDSADTALAGKQPLDATLTALAGLDATAGLVEQTGPDSFTKRAMGVASATDVLTRADGDGRYDAIGSAAAALAAANAYTDDEIAGLSTVYQPLVAFAANEFGARASTGPYGAKPILDGALAAAAGTSGTAGFLRGDGTVSNTLSTSGAAQEFVLESYASLPRLIAQRANGTPGAPTAVTSGQNLFVFSMRGYDGSGFFESASIQFVGTETWLPGTNRGTQIIMRTTANGSASPSTRWVFTHDGNYNPSSDNLYSFGTSSLRVASDHVVQRNTSGAEYHTGEQAVSLTANTDNQTVNSTTRVLRISSNNNYNLTGLTGGAAGRRLTLLNVSAFTITLPHDATSTAANRFFCPNNTNVAVRQNGSVELIYDSTSSRWRVIGA